MQKRLVVLFVALFLVIALFTAVTISKVTTANNNTKYVAYISAIQPVYVAMGRCGELCNDNGPQSSNP
jgi:hypothetical protein